MSTQPPLHVSDSLGRIRLNFNTKTLTEELRSCGTGDLVNDPFPYSACDLLLPSARNIKRMRLCGFICICH